MGKLINKIESAGYKKIPETGIEKALHRAGFTCPEPGWCWDRPLLCENGDELFISCNLKYGVLYTEILHKEDGGDHPRTDDMPDKILRSDDADAFMGWLDRIMEGRL